MHEHVLAATIRLTHQPDAIGAECLLCGAVVSLWAGPTALYGAALAEALDRIAVHCGDHDVETDSVEVRAVLTCRERVIGLTVVEEPARPEP